MRLRRAPLFVFPVGSLLRNKGALAARFLLVETKTAPMGWVPYEPMMPVAQGLDLRAGSPRIERALWSVRAGAGCEDLVWRALLLLLPSLAVNPADASALASLAASPTVATVFVACFGREFGGHARR